MALPVRAEEQPDRAQSSIFSSSRRQPRNRFNLISFRIQPPRTCTTGFSFPFELRSRSLIRRLRFPIVGVLLPFVHAGTLYQATERGGKSTSSTFPLTSTSQLWNSNTTTTTTTTTITSAAASSSSSHHKRIKKERAPPRLTGNRSSQVPQPSEHVHP